MMERLVEKRFRERIMPLILEFENAVNEETKLATNAKFMYGLSAQLKRLLRETQDQIAAELTSVEKEVNKFFSSKISSGIAKSFVDSVNITQKKQQTSEITRVLGKSRMKKLIGIDHLQDAGTKDIVKDTISENVDLIQSIPSQYLGRVKEAVTGGIENGKATKSIAADIKDIGGISERKAQFIARDQLGSTFGKFTKKRNDNLGLKRFKWLTSHDGRVRPSHRELDGHIYEWDKGAEGPEVEDDVRGKVPGEDYNCRCTSTTVEEDIFAMFDAFAE